MTKSSKKVINELKTLNKGDLISLKIGSKAIVAMFISLGPDNDSFIGQLDNKRYKISFEQYLAKGAEAAIRMQNEEKKLIAAKKRALKGLKHGDRIRLTNGKEVIFFKLKQKKFVVAEDGQDDVVFEYYIQAFQELVKSAKPNPEKERMKEIHKKYKGKEIQTSWGPSKVGKLSDDEEYVYMYEFGEELYTITLENFCQEIETYNN